MQEEGKAAIGNKESPLEWNLRILGRLRGEFPDIVRVTEKEPSPLVGAEDFMGRIRALDSQLAQQIEVGNLVERIRHKLAGQGIIPVWAYPDIQVEIEKFLGED